MIVDSNYDIKKILIESRKIAVVGCSRNPEKASYQVPRYMKSQGYRILPVNPFADKIFGERVYKNLIEIDTKVDIIAIFRPSNEILEIVQQSIPLNPKVIWTQLGIRNEKAAEFAQSKDIKVIMDRCMMKEHKRLIKTNDF